MKQVLYSSVLVNTYRSRSQSEARKTSAVAPQTAPAARLQAEYWSLDHAAGKCHNVEFGTWV